MRHLLPCLRTSAMVLLAACTAPAPSGNEPSSSTSSSGQASSSTGAGSSSSSSGGEVTSSTSGGGGTSSSSSGGGVTSSSSSGGGTTSTSSQSASGLLFRSHWDHATGNSLDAITDGDRWDNTVCVIPDGQGSTLIQNILSVVPGQDVGWTATDNVLRVTNRGSTMCGNVETLTAIPQGQSFYARMYIRFEDNQYSFHPVTLNCCGDIQAVLWAADQPDQGNTYLPRIGISNENPFAAWGPMNNRLTKGVWYRFEWWVEFVSGSNARIWPRIYDLDGTLIADENTIRNIYTNERTLAEHYAAGNVHTFRNLDLGRRFGLGYEGSALAMDTGLHWYYAAVEVRSDTWPGPVTP